MAVLRSLYFNDSVRLNINGVLADPLFSTLGVKQGCSLSPILFAIYIDSLVRELQKGEQGVKLGSEILSAMAFADDILCISTTPEGTNGQLETIARWCSKWGMRISESKTVISSLSEQTNWRVGGIGPVDFSFSDSVAFTYLGVSVKVRGRDFLCSQYQRIKMKAD